MDILGVAEREDWIGQRESWRVGNLKIWFRRSSWGDDQIWGLVRHEVD